MIGYEVNGEIRRAETVEEARRLFSADLARYERRENRQLLAVSVGAVFAITSIVVGVIGWAEGWL